MNYDPNLTTCGNMATQTVKLMFALWEHRAEMTVQVRGNCTGLSVIESAVSIAYDQLEQEDCDGMGTMIAKLILIDPAGEHLESSDQDERGEDWLKQMLIAAEIIEIQPEEKPQAPTLSTEPARITLTPEQAESVLPDGEMVHNFVCGGTILIGCDYLRPDAIRALHEASNIEIGGEQCRAMKHGLAVKGEHGWSFFAADEDKLAALEAQLAQ